MSDVMWDWADVAAVAVLCRVYFHPEDQETSLVCVTTDLHYGQTSVKRDHATVAAAIREAYQAGVDVP